jgi:hypothetical protein
VSQHDALNRVNPLYPLNQRSINPNPKQRPPTGLCFFYNSKMKLILQYKFTLLGIALGLIAGYIYYHFWGCTGGCSITSSPLNSTLYGGLMGGLLLNMVEKR